MSNEVLEVIKTRSSARAYSGDEVPQDILMRVIEAGLQSPTGMNLKEIHFSVVKGDHAILGELDEEKRLLRGQGRLEHNFFYEAPVLIILSAQDDAKWNKVDSGIAVMAMSLAAESLGLGSLIIGCIYDAMHGEKKAYFDKAFDIPEGYSFQIALAVGYKTDDKTPHTYEVDSQVSYID